MADSPIQRLILELKRRKVFRVAVVYVVVAWGVIEVAETIFPILRLPPWLLTAVTVLVLLGFPLAVVLAWALEVTPAGVRRTGSGESPVGDGPGPAAWVGLVAVVALTVAGGFIFLSRGDPVPVDRSIAVLPFDNLSGDPENEYFSDGITEDVLTHLSRIGDLRVISRTSVMTYKGSDKTLPDIAGELGVAYILEGSVRRAGERVRVTAQLIHAGSDDHLWAESYDRRLTDIFEIQSEIARAIADELQAELSAAVRERIDGVPTRDLRAYESYLKGRALLDQRTPEAMRQAIDHFRTAIDRDTGYGLAWAGLADAVSLLTFYDYPIPESAPSALEAARRAVALEPELGQAHSALGIAHSIRQDGPEALRELVRATELTPSYPEPHSWYSWVKLMVGQPEGAMEPAARATELDPLAPAFRAYLAEALLANGEWQRALEQARRATELQPQYGLAHFMEGLALYHLGRSAGAEDALRQARSLVPATGEPSHAEIDAVLALARVTRGDTAGGRAILAELEGRPADSDVWFSRGLVLAALGETDAAIRAIGQVEEWGSFSNEHIRYLFPRDLAGVRADPRYRELIAGVDRAWGASGRR